MAVLLTGTGGLFTRLGRIGGLLNSINSFRGTANLSGASIVSTGTGVNNIDAEYLVSRPDLVEGLYSSRESYRLVHGSMTSYLQALAQATVIEMVDDDAVFPVRTLQEALRELIRQMGVSSHRVAAPVTLTVTPAAVAGNNGNGTASTSLIGPSGLNRHYVFPEVIKAACTSDSQLGAVLNSEPFSVLGDSAQLDPLFWDWPKGSGAVTSLSALDPSSTGSNLLTNGGFNTFTVANTPDNWTIETGTAGTHVFSSGAGDSYAGGNALKVTGDAGGTQTALYQTITPLLRPDTVYAVSMVLKKSAGVLAGALEVSLDDAASYQADNAGNLNLFTIAHGSIGTSYGFHNTYFRTSKLLLNTLRFRLRFGTALTSAESVFIDNVTIFPATELYPGGPYAAIFPGSSKFINRDAFTITVANSYATDAKWQFLFERLFGMRALGLQLPTTGTTLISDTLIA